MSHTWKWPTFIGRSVLALDVDAALYTIVTIAKLMNGNVHGQHNFSLLNVVN